MAQEMLTQPAKRYSIEAYAEINQARLLTYTSDGLIQATAGAVVVGVSDTFPVATDTYAASSDCTVIKDGIVKIEASAAIAKGARIKAAADGKAVTAGATDIAYGIAMEAATAAGQLIHMMFVYDNPTTA